MDRAGAILTPSTIKWPPAKGAHGQRSDGGANAPMLVHPEDDPQFTYKNWAADVILAALSATIDNRLGAQASLKS